MTRVFGQKLARLVVFAFKFSKLYCNRFSFVASPIFFDERDLSHLTLPFVFPAQRDIDGLEAAGVMASYFGTLASWRGVNFPVYFDKLPQQQHAIVFATNQHRPSFIRDLPDVTGPTLQLVTHPMNEYRKLLLVLGRDSKDLNTAVRGLVLGNSYSLVRLHVLIMSPH